MGICGHGTAEFVAAPPACARRAANGLQMLPYDEYTFIILHLSVFVNRIFQFFTPFGIIFLRGAKTVPVFADFAPFCAFFAFGHPRRCASCTFPLSARLPFKHEKKERAQAPFLSVAQRKRFELLDTFLHHTISNRARSTAPPSLQLPDYFTINRRKRQSFLYLLFKNVFIVFLYE